MKYAFYCWILFRCCTICAQYSIKVHFLYGSKPRHEFASSESKWFGGKLGGHVGIEIDSNKVFDFVPLGKFHKFPKKNDLNSAFAIHSTRSFWAMFSGKPDSVKKATFVIPVTGAQRLKLDSIVAAYRKQVPYDYAFFGMRCGSAAYDILSQLEILPPCSLRRIPWKVFYPKKLRKMLFSRAAILHWRVYTCAGTDRRNWEQD